MGNKISIIESNDKLVITISSYLSSRAKILFLFYGILMFIPIFFIDKILTTRLQSFGIFPILVVIGSIIIFTLAGNNLLKRVFSKEVLEINSDTLSITNGYFIFNKTKKYKLPLVSQLRLCGYNSTSSNIEGNLGIPGYHAMGGFTKASNVEEAIEFMYDNITTVKLGKNVPSWDAEVMLEKIIPYTNMDLRVSNDKKTSVDITN